MPPTPPPQKSVDEIRNKKPSLHSRLIRMAISFLLGGVAFLVLLVVSGNKSVSEVVDMLKGLL